ncbi:MAG: toll/interleukin-1 receptor domain-containing protein, partial [Lachnospiraceae bacterium]|nr:toll/interleukin-1 receptor domain-containing protein [Lachnospiraceae bacterium]
TDNGKQTEDSEVGMQLFEKLTAKGYKVFFSRVTLKEKLGIEFEPYIFAALKSAPIMVVIGTKPEYFEATWVKNEWTRFLRLKEKDPKKQIFFACDDISDLPKAFARKQAQILEDNSSIDNLVNNICNYLKPLGREAVKESIPARKKVKCPYCGKLQEKNMFGCIYCHREF